MEKNKLNYSPLTQKMYWVDGKGQKTDVTENFKQMVIVWGTGGILPTPGVAYEEDIVHEDSDKEYTVQVYLKETNI